MGSLGGVLGESLSMERFRPVRQDSRNSERAVRTEANSACRSGRIWWLWGVTPGSEGAVREDRGGTPKTLRTSCGIGLQYIRNPRAEQTVEGVRNPEGGTGSERVAASGRWSSGNTVPGVDARGSHERGIPGVAQYSAHSA